MSSQFHRRVFIDIIFNESTRPAITFLRQKGVLKNEIACISCGIQMDECVRKNIDMCAFRCMNKRCLKYKQYKSIRTNSFLSKYSCDLRKFIHFIYKFSKESKQSEIIEEVGISESLIYKISDNIRKNASIYFNKFPVKLGGHNIIVEIDESMFNHKVKAHRGRSPRNQCWVFGMVDTSYNPARGFLKHVINREKNTLLPIIADHVLTGSIIHSDEWAAYNDIYLMGYQHGRICHKYKFICYESGVHTQHIESYWNKQKNRIRKMMGLKKTVLENSLCLFMFFDWFSIDLFNEIFNKLLF